MNGQNGCPQLLGWLMGWLTHRPRTH